MERVTTATELQALPSFAATLDIDPFGFYERAREQKVVWDEGVNAWLVTSYDELREVMRQDKKLVRHAVADIPDDALHTISGGKRSRLLLHGPEHAAHHRWFVHRFTYTLVDQWRETLLRPIADKLLDQVAASGQVEILRDYSDKFSIRVIAAVMGLPWEDDDWINYCKGLLDRKQRYLDLYFTSPGPEVEKNALDAVVEMNELLLPFVMAAKERPPKADDVLALLWSDGPSIMPDWGLEDMQAWIATTFFAGTDTTTHAIQNAIYLLLQNPELQEEVRTGGPETLERYAEEVLRLYPSVHFTRRLANQDFELAGAHIKKDDRMLMLDASANRDAQRFGCPADVDLQRDRWREHMAFSVGPRTCAGAALARAEIQESVARLLDRFSPITLDPDADAPQLRGFLLRSYRPLHAVFTPTA
jgi:cytochrome P450